MPVSNLQDATGTRTTAVDDTRAAVIQALQRRRRGGLSPGFIWLAALLFSPVLGLAAVFGVVPLLALVSMVSAVVLVVFPITGVWVVAVSALVVAGLVELYLPGLQQIRWVPVLISILLAGSSLVSHLARVQRGNQEPAVAGADGHVIVLLATLFFAFSCVAALLSGNGVLGAVTGLKGYFQVWGLWVALLLLRVSLAQAARMVWWLLPLALLQWPVVLHQFLVLVPIRRAMEATTRGLVAIDVVSGTFGGSMVGGGRSPTLAVLSMAGLVLAVMCYRTGRIRSSALTWLLCALCVGPLAFSEVKIVFVLLPLTLLLLFGRLITVRPLAVILGTVVAGAALFGALTLYSTMIAVKGGSGVKNYIESSFAYNVGAQGYGSSAVNRLTVYGFWWAQHDKSGGVARTLFGHGPGAVNTTSLTGRESLAMRLYSGFSPGLTGLSTLLWEVGAFGALAFVSLLVAVYRSATWLAQHPGLVAFRAELTSARIVIAMLSVSLLHNNLLLIDLATQTLLALAIGLVLVARREAALLPTTPRKSVVRAFGIRPLHPAIRLET